MPGPDTGPDTGPDQFVGGGGSAAAALPVAVTPGPYDIVLTTDGSGLLTVPNSVRGTALTSLVLTDATPSQFFSGAGTPDSADPPGVFTVDLSATPQSVYQGAAMFTVGGNPVTLQLAVTVALLPPIDLTLGLPSASPDDLRCWTGGPVYVPIISALSGQTGLDVSGQLDGQPCSFAFSDGDLPASEPVVPGVFGLRGSALFATCSPGAAVPAGRSCQLVWLAFGGGAWQGAGVLYVAAGAGTGSGTGGDTDGGDTAQGIDGDA